MPHHRWLHPPAPGRAGEPHTRSSTVAQRRGGDRGSGQVRGDAFHHRSYGGTHPRGDGIGDCWLQLDSQDENPLVMMCINLVTLFAYSTFHTRERF